MISYTRKKLVQIFMLAQLLDLLTTLVGILYFGFHEINPAFSNISLLHLSFNKIMVALILSTYMLSGIVHFRFIKIMNTISSIPVFLNTIQIVLEVL